MHGHSYGLSDADANRHIAGDDLDEAVESAKRNPIWNRNELILALDLYLRHRASPPSKTSNEVADLSTLLGVLAGKRDASQAQTFRNVNGVYMKMMNFRRFDPDYTVNGKVGLVRGNKLEEVVWNEFHANPAALAGTVAAIREKRRIVRVSRLRTGFLCATPRNGLSTGFLIATLSATLGVLGHRIESGLRRGSSASFAGVWTDALAGTATESRRSTLEFMRSVKLKVKHLTGQAPMTSSGAMTPAASLDGRLSAYATCGPIYRRPLMTIARLRTEATGYLRSSARWIFKPLRFRSVPKISARLPPRSVRM